VVVVSGGSGLPDQVIDFEVILQEFKSFGAGLENKPMILAASKLDVANRGKLAKLRRFAKARGLKLIPISAVSGAGIEQLKYEMAEQVEQIRAASKDLAGK
jgi:GTP-binding protein